MRLVGVAHDLCGAPGDGGAEDGSAERRLGGARAEIIRRASDGDLHAAGVVRVEEARRGPVGIRQRFDVLRPQRLARPAVVYVEQFSAHPLEADAAELYGPPDGYLDASGNFHHQRQSAGDKAVYEVELRPDDGLYPLPYMARQADGRSWDADGVQEIAPAHQSRQPFFPDGSRPVEEIDRLGIGEHGTGNLMSAYAEIDFFRVLPASGYKKGLPAGQRTDIGEGDIPPEALGQDFFPYRPPHLGQHPLRLGLARIVNVVQAALAGGTYAGAIWTQGSPRIERRSTGSTFCSIRRCRCAATRPSVGTA